MQQNTQSKNSLFGLFIFTFTLIAVTSTPFLTPSIGLLFALLILFFSIFGLLKFSKKSLLIQLSFLLGLGLLIITLLFGTLPPLSSTRLKGRRVTDSSNLKQIGTALENYRVDHAVYPKDLGQLLDDGYITDSRILICPVQEMEIPLNGTDVRNGKCGYLYWGNKLKKPTPETIIASTKPKLLNRPGIFRKGFLKVLWQQRTLKGDNYINVLYLDGHSTGFLWPPDDIKEFIDSNP